MIKKFFVFVVVRAYTKPKLPETSSGVHVVATTNSLFETTDESCQLISRIPIVLLIDPCENCAYFCHKNGRNWHFSGFPFMVSDNSTFISQLGVNMFHTNL